MFGDYPSSMRSRVGSRLPVFTGSQSALMKGSLDFVGINHYTTYYARNNDTNLIGTLLHDAVSDSGTVTLRKKCTLASHLKLKVKTIVMSIYYHFIDNLCFQFQLSRV